MKIKMLETNPGSEDGFTVKDYEAGHEYEVGDALGRAFVDAKHAEEVKAQSKPEQPVAKPAHARKGK